MSTVKLSGQQSMLVTWGGLILVGGIVAYIVVKYGLPKLAGGAASGAANTLDAVNQGFSNNNLTNSATDLAGDKVTAYGGRGVVGSLGAEANALSGGSLASAGESLGGWLYSAFNKTPDPTAPVYIVQFPDGAKHGVDSNNIDGSGYFSYAGQRFRLGQVNGQKVATTVYTGTGV
jgi:hypothetical protein